MLIGNMLIVMLLENVNWEYVSGRMLIIYAVVGVLTDNYESHGRAVIAV